MAKRKKGHNEKKINNDLENTTQKTKDWASQTPLKTGCELGCYCNICTGHGKRYIGAKPIIHQSELRTYTKVVLLKEKSSFRFVVFWNKN